MFFGAGTAVDPAQRAGRVYSAYSRLRTNKKDAEGRGFVRKSSPSACVIGRNDWIVGKINHIGGLQNGQVHL